MKRILALDAMGVIYRSGDDVAELLVPFLRAKGCHMPTAEIHRLYQSASLGLMTSDQFWTACALEPGSDQDYCQGHELTPGIETLIRDAGMPVVVLTNDLSEWSRVLRTRFELDDLVADWVVSAEIGVRKPDPKAYAALLERVDCAAAEVLFFDDRSTNVDAARRAGIDAHLFRDVDQARSVVGI